MKKLFISQPMNGRTNEKIIEERNKAHIASEIITGEKLEVIDSFFQNAPHDAKPLWFMGESIKLMAEADYVYFAPGWENARGCVIEHECAIKYGLDVI